MKNIILLFIFFSFCSALKSQGSNSADFAGFIKINTDSLSNTCIQTRGKQALWFNGTYYSWGFGGIFNQFRDPIHIGGSAQPGANVDLMIDRDLDVNGLAVMNDLSVSEEASFGKGLLSSDPIKLREAGNGPAGPEMQFMSDNSTTTVGASIKFTNSTAGGNNRNLKIENRSVGGDISFILDGGDTHMRMSNGNNFSYVPLSPWIHNTTDLGLTSKRWRNIYSNDLDIDGLASLNDLSVSEEAALDGLMSTDPIKLREGGNGPAGPEIQFMSDNSTTTIGASIKFTNSTGGGNDRDLKIENKSVVGDISFILDGGDTHMRMSNGNNFSYVPLSPWISNTTDLGSTGKRWRTIYAQNALNTSDLRLKHNVQTVEDVLPKIMQLQATNYNYNSDAPNEVKTIGFIAQEVEKVDRDWVVAPKGENEYYLLNYNNFSVLAIKAIQEQQGIIERQQENITLLSSELMNLKELFTTHILRTDDKISNTSNKEK